MSSAVHENGSTRGVCNNSFTNQVRKTIALGGPGAPTAPNKALRAWIVHQGVVQKMQSGIRPKKIIQCATTWAKNCVSKNRRAMHKTTVPIPIAPPRTSIFSFQMDVRGIG